MAGKIIFVNSYKGGAGKTTLAMMHCIDDLFHKKAYKNVIYIDLDILGTGTRYLFDENKLPEDKCFDITEKPVMIELKEGKETAPLYVAYLSPSFNGHFALGGQHFINHPEIAEESLREKVMKFISKCIDAEPETLFVLDCAPGFSKFEQNILKSCYNLDKKITIQEEYVTTMDSSHIRKCIQCLNDTQTGFEIDIAKRDISIYINDMQNFEGYLLPDKDSAMPKIDKITELWNSIKKYIKNSLNNRKIKIYRWKYSQNISVRTTFHYEQKLENNVRDYLFTINNIVKI